jgi:hypothetical protein
MLLKLLEVRFGLVVLEHRCGVGVVGLGHGQLLIRGTVVTTSHVQATLSAGVHDASTSINTHCRRRRRKSDGAIARL